MARYKVNEQREYLAALNFINTARERNQEIELKIFYQKRTNPQNRYLHMALGYFAHCYGCTLIEAKEIYFKQYACRDLFLVDTEDKNGKHVRYFRSTADLDSQEMSSAISNFTAFASCCGIEIPAPNDELGIRYCERQIETTKSYGT